MLSVRRMVEAVNRQIEAKGKLVEAIDRQVAAKYALEERAAALRSTEGALEGKTIERREASLHVLTAAERKELAEAERGVRAARHLAESAALVVDMLRMELRMAELQIVDTEEVELAIVNEGLPAEAGPVEEEVPW